MPDRAVRPRVRGWWLDARRRPRVTVYTRVGCGLCRAAEELAATESARADLELVDIDGDESLLVRYHVRVPVVAVDGDEIAEGRLQPGEVRRAVRTARRR